MTGLSRTRVVATPLVALVAVLALAPAVGLGQPVPPPGPPDPLGGSPDPVVLPTNRKSANQIKAAHEYIAAKDWDNAVKLLQRVLDEPEDSLLETEVKDPQGKVTVLRSSARAEAERLVATLPKPGLATYRVKVGGFALVALGKARANPLLLDEVVRRYFLTDAGTDALTLMAVSELDHGRVEEAAERFRRLMQRPDLDDLPLLTLFQAALAFHGANDGAHEDKAVQALAHRLPAAGLAIGGQNLSLDDLRKEIARWPATSAASPDWPLFRGDLRRSGGAEGDLPLLEARRRTPIPASEEAAKLSEEAAKLLAPVAGAAPVGGGSSLPGFVPLAVRGKLIYRGPDGLHALDVDSGVEAWHHASPMCLDSVLNDDQKKWQVRRWLGEKYRGLPSLLDENATLGTLSSDGRRVFFVEDLPFPPHPQDLLDMQQGVKHFFSTAEEHIYHNRLRAVDVLTGDKRWEIGGWQKPGDPVLPGPREFADAFFLGAPLPVGRRLFALVERHQELNLLCLDADTGDLVWSQNLASSSEDLKLDPARRMQPVHLAYADGVLVCPTNVGAVVAVDPLSHNLLWAHIYHDRSTPPDPNAGVGGFIPEQYEAQWRGCAPIIHGDRVILTAPDGDSIRCLNLRDGSLVWNALRTDEDLYVAGVFEDKAGGDKVLVVGKSSCRALGLAKGDEVWTQPTGAPSGLGVASGKRYLLPLQDGGVYLVDMNNHQASTEIEGKHDEVLGNLVFHGGDLWSQSATAVVAFPQFGKGLERAEARIAKDPHDPVARIDRGRLLYVKGEAARAVEDWLVALDNNPPADLASQTRDRLFTVLTQLLQENFAANEKFLDQYDKLCRRPAPAGDTPEQAKAYLAEQHRRLLSLLALTGRGREAQGRADLALKAYRDLYEAVGPNEMMAVPEDPSVRIRADLWAQERVAALTRAATPAQQKPLQEQINTDWKAAQSAGDVSGLVRFIGLYGTVPGPLGAAGREARLTLAERWVDERDRRRALEAEQHLHYLRKQTDAPETAARAQYAWARLLTRHGLLADAVEAYRALARDFPAVAVHDGHTGAALLEDLATDKRFVAYLDDPLAAHAPGRAKVVEIQEKNTPKTGEIPCDPQDGVPPPGFHNLRLSIDAQTFALQVASKDGTAEPWSTPLPVPVAYLRQYIQEGSGFSVTYQASDHFLVISLGPVIAGVDRIERRARWVRSLLAGDLPANSQLTPGGADGSVWVNTNDGRPNQRLGLLGPIGPGGAYVQTRAGVAALDLSTGDLRWLRTDSAAMLDAFGDEQHLYLVESHAAGDVRAIRAVQTADGVSVPIADCVDCYNHRLRTLGRCLLSSDLGPKEELVVRFYDVQAGKDLWKKTFPAHSVVLDSAVPELTAVASPDGTVTVVDLTSQKELAKLAVEPKHLDKLVRGMLLRDQTQYYLALQGPPDPASNVIGDPGQYMTASVKWQQVNGPIYAFDRATGAVNWCSMPALNQMLLVDHVEESPVLLLTALVQKQLPGAPGGVTTQVTTTRSIDKRTGKILYRKELTNNPDPYFTIEIDVRAGTIDLVNTTTRLRHCLDAGKDAADHPDHKGA